MEIDPDYRERQGNRLPEIDLKIRNPKLRKRKAYNPNRSLYSNT